MILVDSSVWIDLLRGRRAIETEYLANLLFDGSAAIGELMLIEVLQGIIDDREFRSIRPWLVQVPLVIISDVDVALAAADNYRSLRARGITIRKTIDTLIATRCIVDDYALLYSDRDFDPFVEHLGLRSAMA